MNTISLQHLPSSREGHVPTIKMLQNFQNYRLNSAFIKFHAWYDNFANRSTTYPVWRVSHS